MIPFNNRFKEMLETLAGQRSKKNRKAAVLVEDLSGLFQLRNKLKSAKAAGATPTKEEFDALVDDFHQLDARLKEIQTALQKKYL